MTESIRLPVWQGLRAVVFDFDGTLARTRIDFALMRERAAEVIREWGAWQPALEIERYTLEMVEAAAAGLRSEPERAAGLLAAAMQAVEDVEMEACAAAEPFPHVPEALRALREMGLSIGVITRNCRRAVEPVLARHSLLHDALLTRNDVARVKPAPGHLLACLQALGVSPAQSLLVGDHPTDMQCGRAAGAATCGVLTDTSDEAALLAAGADRVLPDVRAAVALVTGDTSGGRGVGV